MIQKKYSNTGFRKGVLTAEQFALYLIVLFLFCMILQMVFGKYLDTFTSDSYHKASNNLKSFRDLFCNSRSSKCSLSRFTTIENNGICKISGVYYIKNEFYVIKDPNHNPETVHSCLKLFKATIKNKKIHLANLDSLNTIFPDDKTVDLKRLEDKSLLALHPAAGYYQQILGILSAWSCLYSFNIGHEIENYELSYEYNERDVIGLLGLNEYRFSEFEYFKIKTMFVFRADLLNIKDLKNVKQKSWPISPLTKSLEYFETKASSLRPSKKKERKTIALYLDAKSESFPDQNIILQYLNDNQYGDIFEVELVAAVVHSNVFKTISSADVVIGYSTEDFLWAVLSASKETAIIEVHPTGHFFSNFANLAAKKYLSFDLSRINTG